MKLSEIYKAAKEVIAKPEAWTQGVTAIDAEGYGVPCDYPSAVCFCIVGALGKVDVETLSMRTNPSLHTDFRDAMKTTMPIGEWNDEPKRTHTEVLEAMNKMIAFYEAKGV